MIRLWVPACLFVSFLAGCGQQQPPPNKGGINITAPGVNINIDPEGAAKVQAPGVQVNTDPKGGAKVDAPNVNIQVPGVEGKPNEKK